MHDPVQAYYAYTSLNDAVMRIFNLKQEDGEYFTDYVKRLK